MVTEQLQPLHTSMWSMCFVLNRLFVPHISMLHVLRLMLVCVVLCEGSCHKQLRQ
jgi:hypothetical protein